MTQDKRYVCPECTAVLNQDDPKQIRLQGTISGPGFILTTPFELSAELGVYGARFDAGLTLEKGCRVDFACPDCGHDFTASFNPDLAEIGLCDGADEYVVVFSRIYGTKSSFIVERGSKKVIASYGEDASAYVGELGRHVNFFGS